MRRLCLLLICLLCLGGSTPEPERTPTLISSREDLEAIVHDPYGSYVLNADIDLGEEPWIPIPFFGMFDGAGYTIGNLTVTEPGQDTAITYDGNDKQYDTVFGGLFSVVRSAEIRNLNLMNAEISIATDRDCFLGSIAGYACDTIISDCTVYTRQKLSLTSVNVGVGGLIGFSENSSIENCEIDAELIFEDTNQDLLCEEFLGGVFSCGYGSVSSCNVRLRGYADVYGYAHNGGVIGMFKLAPKMRRATFTVQDSTVDAEIYFFEITRSRRAYCKPFVGEDSYELCRLKRNQEAHYLRKESKQGLPQRPEMCESPVYSVAVKEATCTEWGYSTYTCNECGYSFRDDYTLPRHTYQMQTVPATCTEDGCTVYTCSVCGDTFTETIPCSGHTPADWTVVLEPDVDTSGREELCCSVCGAVLEERTIHALGPTLVQSISVTKREITLHPGESATLSVSIEPEDATDKTIRFISSDPSLAVVDENGRITAIASGTATVTIFSADGNTQASCLVTVVPIPEEKKETSSFFSWLRCAPDE